MQWLKHAFAVDPPGPAEPSDAQRAPAERICREVVRRHLTTPALLFLEMSRPLNNVAAHLLHFFTPVLSVFTDAAQLREFARFLERRGSIDFLCRRIEALEAGATRREHEQTSACGAAKDTGNSADTASESQRED